MLNKLAQISLLLSDERGCESLGPLIPEVMSFTTTLTLLSGVHDMILQLCGFSVSTAPQSMYGLFNM